MKKTIDFLGIVILLLILSGCNNGQSNTSQEKLATQVRYLDAKIIGMVNRLNNISFENYTVTSRQVMINSSEEENANGSEENSITVNEMVPDNVLLADTENIDWDTLKQEIELLKFAWSTIILNLYSMGIEAEAILGFSRDLDIAIINIRGQDKRGSLTSLARLYSYLPRYLENIEEEVVMKHIKETKSFIINAYALVEQRNWAEVGTNIEAADNAFRNVINNLEYVRDNEFKVNRAYVLLKELERSLEFRDSQIFYMNYRNVMQALSII